jgi:deoxyribodipyrimidine photolyase-related protein
MSEKKLILVLGDQLSRSNPALQQVDPASDTILLAEVAEETRYVRHNRHKIALIFSAMRHFRDELAGEGHTVIHYALGQGVESLLGAVERALEESGAESVHVCAPGEYRLQQAMTRWEQKLSVPVTLHSDSRFLASIDFFRQWARGKKQLRMEYFYRSMRKRYELLLEEDGKPAGGRWNYDAENRGGWRGQTSVPERPRPQQDEITRRVIREVQEAFPDNPGDLERFSYAVTAQQAQAEFDWFIEHALGHFGTFQDALADESPWLFHAVVSMYLNIGLLEPLACCRRVEQAWREGRCSLADAEGFIRQVLGWREYVRGVYWLFMPDYRERNGLTAEEPLPAWFWNGQVEMRCLSRALRQTLDLGYAHHIQRLMVIGNFALLAGLDVRAVCDWYLAVYVDAFEWVELPNTLGMALHADGGLMASKPYAASGKYIQRQGDHCRQCRYDPASMTGEGACPYNALYWRFIDRHEKTLAGNGRMGLVLSNWAKRSKKERRAIVDWGDRVLEQLLRDPG